jgi:two-component system OmpR family sensor kinase
MRGERRAVRLGFRARVLGSLLALVVVALGVGLLIQRAVLLERLHRAVDDELTAERAELEALALGLDPATGDRFGGDLRGVFDAFLERNVPVEGEVFLTFVEGAPYKATPAPIRLDEDPIWGPRFASLTRGERGGLTTADGPVRYVAVPMTFEGRAHGVFVVARFTRSARAEIDATIRVAAAVTLGVLVAATGVAWLVAGRLLRPVRQLTEAAESINDADLERRIPVTGTDEIARLASRFNEMLDRLALAFARQRTFVDDAGHELRTPITIVRGHLELMGDDPRERVQTVALVTDELDRMARIVDDLLLLANAEQLDFVHLVEVDVAELTTGVLTKARLLGDRAWRLDSCGDGALIADPQRITQAVLNLVRNAVEHTAPGDEIGIGSAWSTHGLRLWVRDTGPGIGDGDRERIFERFARGGERRRRSEGAGLGLAIVKSIVDAHGGRVEVLSRPGSGATFTIVLPGTSPAPPSDHSGAAALAQPIGGAP